MDIRSSCKRQNGMEKLTRMIYKTGKSETRNTEMN